MNELVFPNEKGQSVTTSLKVAEVFGKEHKNVLRDIETLSCSDEFRRLNFEHTPYVHPQNGQTYHYYQMTKDGFSFLVMGYTGEKAGQFKEQFIAEFNHREELLKSDEYIVARAMEIQKKRIIALESNIQEKEKQLQLAQKQLEYQAPVISYATEVLSSTSDHTVTTIASQFNMSAVILNRLLVLAGFIRKTGKEYSLCAKYQGRGYTHAETFKYEGRDGGKRSKIELKYTEKGRMKIFEIIQKAISAEVLKDIKGRYFINKDWKPGKAA